MRLRLRTQLLLVTMAVSTALTATSLLVVRQSVRSEVRKQITRAMQASVADFVRIQQQQNAELQRSAAMLSELPTLKSLMTAQDRATIQDASAEFWDLSQANLLLLANTSGELMAVHADSPGMSYQTAAALLSSAVERSEENGLWQDKNGLFRVVTRPIVAGAGSESHSLGLLVLGKRIDNSVARELGSFAGSEVVLAGGGAVFAATQNFDPRELQDIYQQSPNIPRDVRLGSIHYTLASVELPAAASTPIRCYLLLPLTDWDAFLSRLNQMILVLGLLTALGGAILVLLISRAITSPLESLVAAVRALATGNYQYALRPAGSMEVSDLASAFNTMRQQLMESQRKRLEAERLAALGRAAGSISHDLRHHLAALVANAEFLHGANELQFDRDEVYLEVQRASIQMTELIDSLVEIARERPMLSLSPVDLSETISRASEAVRARPEFRDCEIAIEQHCRAEGWFDARKLERAFFNLLLNACEAGHGRGGISVSISGNGTCFECRVADHGNGIPSSVLHSLFEPFVSAGKANGTGLGLAIARKVVEDHRGTLALESTSEGGTVFLVVLPRNLQTGDARADGNLGALLQGVNVSATETTGT